jgi:outer membrane protein assembly factor BamB
LPVPAASRLQHLAVQAGKDSILRLLNLDNLSNQGTGPLAGRTGGEVATLNVPQGGRVATAPAVWVNPADSSTWTFVANDSGVSGLKLAVDGSGNPSLSAVWQTSTAGTSPVVANGVLYVAASGSMRALLPTTGAVLWQDTTIGGIHWESPVVANGVLYIADENGSLTAFALPPAPPVPALQWVGVPLLAIGLLLGGLRRVSSAFPGARASQAS